MSTTRSYVIGPFELDEDLFELRKGSAVISVEPKVLSLLLLLVKERHRSIDKQEILAKLWPGVAVGEASLSRAVMCARKAIEDEAHRAIVTVRGRGFRFAAPVRERSSAPPTESEPFARLAGNTAAVAAMKARLESAAAGRGSTIWLTGEPGIGKTAMVEELARAARDRGMRVLATRCHDAATSPPYWPWTQLARSLAGEGRPASLRWLLAAGESSVDATSEFARFDGFMQALRAAATSAPVLLSIEDVQWADDASIAMLRFVGREVADSAVLVVATYRDSPPIHGARGEMLTGAVHASGAISIPLRALDADAAALFVERTTGAALAPDVVARLHEKSGGNPLYLRELLKADGTARRKDLLTSHSADMTDGLRKSIERHLDGLSAESREMLTLAALLGQTFDFAMLAAVSGLRGDVVLDRLAEATTARIVEKSATGTYRFRHALVRSVLSRTLVGNARAKGHATIARLLDAHWEGTADAHAEELSYHYVRALPLGDARRALEISLRAAELATSRGAHERAISLYRRAIESIGHLAGEGARGAELHLLLARAWEQRSREGARAPYLDAVVLATALRNAEVLGEAALGVARTSPLEPGRDALLLRAREALATSPGERARELVREIDRALASTAG